MSVTGDPAALDAEAHGRIGRRLGGGADRVAVLRRAVRRRGQGGPPFATTAVTVAPGLAALVDAAAVGGGDGLRAVGPYVAKPAVATPPPR